MLDLEKELEKLLTRYEASPENEGRLDILVEDIFNVVIRLTDTEDAWYYYLSYAYGLMYKKLGICLTEELDRDVAEWVEIHCESWVEPSIQNRDKLFTGIIKGFDRLSQPPISEDNKLEPILYRKFPADYLQWESLAETLLGLFLEPIEAECSLGPYQINRVGVFLGALHNTKGSKNRRGRCWDGFLQITPAKGLAELGQFPFKRGKRVVLISSECPSYLSHIYLNFHGWVGQGVKVDKRLEWEAVAKPGDIFYQRSPPCTLIQSKGQPIQHVVFEIDLSAFLWEGSTQNPVFSVVCHYLSSDPNLNIAPKNATYLLRNDQGQEGQRIGSTSRFRVVHRLAEGDHRLVWRISNVQHARDGLLCLFTRPCDLVVKSDCQLLWPPDKPNPWPSYQA